MTYAAGLRVPARQAQPGAEDERVVSHSRAHQEPGQAARPVRDRSITGSASFSGRLALDGPDTSFTGPSDRAGLHDVRPDAEPGPAVAHEQWRPVAGRGGPQVAAAIGADRHVKKKSRALTLVNSTAAGGSAVAVLSPREGVVVRGILGGGRVGLRRMATGVRVVGLGAAELEVEVRVEGGGQRG